MPEALLPFSVTDIEGHGKVCERDPSIACQQGHHDDCDTRRHALMGIRGARWPETFLCIHQGGVRRPVYDRTHAYADDDEVFLGDWLPLLPYHYGRCPCECHREPTDLLELLAAGAAS